MGLQEREGGFLIEGMQEPGRPGQAVKKGKEEQGRLLPAAKEAGPEFPMLQKQVLPAVQGRSRYLEISADLCNCAAVAEIGFQDMQNKPEAVLAVGNEGVFQKGMRMPTGTLHTKDHYMKNDRFAVLKVNNVTFIAAMSVKLTSGMTDWAVFR